MNINKNSKNLINSQDENIILRNKKNKNLPSLNSDMTFGLKKSNFQKVFMKDKFINLLMIDGKKSVAARLVFDSLFFLKQKYLKEDSKKRMNFSSFQTEKTFNKVKTESIKSSSNNLENIKENLSVLDVLSIAIENVTPSVEVRKVRRAGNTFLIPAILSQHKANTLAMRWIIESARKKQQGSNQNFAECLADEIYQAYSKQGKARQKRDELHNIATQNRANIRFRWW